MWGITAVLPRNANTAARIFDELAGLFSCGPQRMVLTGSYSRGDDYERGQYEQFSVSKTAAVRTFRS
ncbi:MAG: hypothetical protein ACRD3Q_19055, partial [Terriglobales bacterium]